MIPLTDPARGVPEAGPLCLRLRDGDSVVVADVVTVTAWARAQRAEATASLLKVAVARLCHAVDGLCHPLQPSH